MKIGGNVLAARHAVAIDERRLGFPPTLWEGIEEANLRPHCIPGQPCYLQRWFVGTHGDVGGGAGSPLSAAPLKWIAEGAAECGLRFYATYGADESPLDKVVREAGLIFNGAITWPRFWNSLSPMNYPIYSRRIWVSKTPKDKPTSDFASTILDPTVALRLNARDVRPRYRPGPLKPFRALLIRRDASEPSPKI
jgi:hypothetical protein